MTRHVRSEEPAPRTSVRSLAIALLLCPLGAVAQTNLGELLDAGATPLSAEEFRKDVVGRIVVGPTTAGGSLELMYTPNGIVAGTGSIMRSTYTLAPVDGAWKIDEDGRICTSMRIAGHPSAPAFAGQYMLPPRCQRWFRYAGGFFVSDSDSDRGAKVLRRALKP